MAERVLIVHNEYQIAAGEHAAVQAQIALLRARGHEVDLFLRDNAAIRDFGWAERARSVPRTLFSTESYRALRRLARQSRPDVAHVHNVFPLISPAAYHALAAEGVPIVQTVHNFRFLCPNALFFTQGQVCERCRGGNTLHAIRYRCYRDSVAASALYAAAIGAHRRAGTWDRIDRFVALTPFAAAKLVESGLTTPERVAVLGNFILEPLPAPGSFAHRDPFVLYMGRLSPEKGVETLIRAMAEVPELILKIMGEGSEGEALRALAARGAGRVEFLGYVQGEAKWALLRAARATVLPAVWYEHFPISLLESFAVGTPMVASNLGSLATLIRHNETGLLSEPGDAASLAAQLRRLAADPALAVALGRRAREEVEQRHTASIHYDRLRHIYGDVIAAKRREGAHG